MDRAPTVSRVTAVLGPTNTGKTHFAMERMLAHKSGMIGFPLRLLARENYDKAVRLKGAHAVALVTGEEKIVPPGPAYYLCTVEAMPAGLEVDFLAVDEVQLAADPERGHVFTERLLGARGREETMFIGAETVRRILRQLVPEAELVSRPRLSRLAYAGPKKVTRLPPRSAVIGFSATEVYSLAELMRRRRGGTAVVLGALSPRTRNAQVDMYQAGEVDYLVATDAIGMGLNMDIRHVAFSRLTKFDGRATRLLSHAEVAQIAGRAGRHMADGTFGTTAGLEPFEPELVAAVENHDFPPVKQVFWRNAELDFASPAALVKSLTQAPPGLNLVPARAAEDFRVLASLVRQPDVTAAATTRQAVRLLWEVCQIPDFRKVVGESHVRLVGRIYRDLTSGGRIDPDWIARQVERVDRTTGDIGTLVGRIADIRTWTYVSHHADWLDDAGHWQDRTRAIEDRLSDALHERLTQRFVDRRTAALVRGLRGSGELSSSVRADGEVFVEGAFVGRLAGFRFFADGDARHDDARAIRSAVHRTLASAIAERVRAFESLSDGGLTLGREGTVTWEGETVGRLARGPHVFAPAVAAVTGELLDPAQRRRVQGRLEGWLAALLRRRLGPLFAVQDAKLSGAGRGLAFQLAEGLGVVPRRQVAAQVTALTKADRRTLTGMGVCLGRLSVYLPALFKTGAAELRALLWSVHTGREAPGLPWGRPVLRQVRDAPGDLILACGYRRAGDIALRADRLDALAVAADKLARQGPFGPVPALSAAAGCTAAELSAAMALLGFRWIDDPAGGRFERKARRRKAAPGGRRGRNGGKAKANPCSPFAALKKQLTVQE